MLCDRNSQSGPFVSYRSTQRPSNVTCYCNHSRAIRLHAGPHACSVIEIHSQDPLLATDPHDVNAGTPHVLAFSQTVLLCSCAVHVDEKKTAKPGSHLRNHSNMNLNLLILHRRIRAHCAQPRDCTHGDYATACYSFRGYLRTIAWYQLQQAHGWVRDSSQSALAQPNRLAKPKAASLLSQTHARLLPSCHWCVATSKSPC